MCTCNEFCIAILYESLYTTHCLYMIEILKSITFSHVKRVDLNISIKFLTSCVGEWNGNKFRCVSVSIHVCFDGH